LTVGGVGVLIYEELGLQPAGEFVAACHQLTGGNPLFVRELLAASRAEGLRPDADQVDALCAIAPTAVGPSVLARLARLGADAVALARSVAILGDGAEVVTAAELSGIDVTSAELVADSLALAQILAPSRPLEFFNPLIADSLYEDLAPGERRLAHRRAATILDRDGDVGRVASHLLVSGPGRDEWVTERLRRAAQTAIDRGAPDVAATYLRRALDEPPPPEQRGELLLMLGTAEWRAGGADAIPHLEEVLTVAGDEQTRLAATSALAWAYYILDRAERAVSVLERGLESIHDRDSPAALALEGALIGAGQADAATAASANRRADRLHARLDELRDPPVDLLGALALDAARRHRHAQPADEAEALVERALACTPYPPPIVTSTSLIATLILVERYDLVERLCHDLLAVARWRGSLNDLGVIAVYRARSLYCAGELADAEADARVAAESAGPHGGLHGRSTLCWVLIERGELDHAQAALESGPEPSRWSGISKLNYLSARGHLRAAQGRFEEAVCDLEAAGAFCRQLDVELPTHRTWRGEAALAHHALGHPGEAARLTREDVELARRFGRPRRLGQALRAQGLVSPDRERVELLHESVEVLERSRSPIELARARADYGAALRRQGQRRDAREQLEQALDLAHRCGARGIANQARGELVILGARPRRDAISGRDALTASELRVARLAAEGMTNREVAQALFITSKTASAHLSRVYRKLEITRRDQLSDALGANAPAPDGNQLAEPSAMS
jgi:DNA-binding CsgD family transcriptional regulator